MNPLSNRVLQLAESETLAMSRLSNELKDKGVNVINMSLGEPDFTTPLFVKTAAKQAIDENYSYYTPVQGYKDLLEAICAKFKRDNNLTYKTSQIITSTGAKQSIANVVFAMINPGDEVILPVPYWVSYAEMVQLAGGVVKEIKSSISTDFKITPEQLDKAITKNTKLFIFSNPCNPSGTLYSKKELQALVEVFETCPHVYIVSDEIYEHINFIGQHTSLASFQTIYDRVITVNGLSKAFAMTGWRLGYMAGPEEIVKACIKFQGQFTSGTCSITQRAAIAALKADSSQIRWMGDQFKKRRDLIVSLARTIPNIIVNEPHGAFYLFPDVSFYFGKSFNGKVIKDAKELCMYLLNEGHLALTPGGSFGSPECIRFSYATSEENIHEAMKRFKLALEKLK
jgi:aspartate aminotransferase